MSRPMSVEDMVFWLMDTAPMATQIEERLREWEATIRADERRKVFAELSGNIHDAGLYAQPIRTSVSDHTTTPAPKGE